MSELTNIQKQQAHLLLEMRNIYEDVMGSEYGNLHIILADGNYRDSDVVFCNQWCNESGDYIGKEICKLLFEFTETQRADILDFTENDYELSYDEYHKTLIAK